MVPVPLHWRRRVSRGYNQSEELARAVAKISGWPMLNLWRGVRRTPERSHTQSVADSPRGCAALLPACRKDLGPGKTLSGLLMTSAPPAQCCTPRQWPLCPAQIFAPPRFTPPWFASPTGPKCRRMTVLRMTEPCQTDGNLQVFEAATKGESNAKSAKGTRRTAKRKTEEAIRRFKRQCAEENFAQAAKKKLMDCGTSSQLTTNN